MGYDALLEKVSGRRFELMLFILFFVNGLPNSLMITTFTFIHYLPPSYRCVLPDSVAHLLTEPQNSSTHKATLNFMIPFDPEDGGLSKCYRFNRSENEIQSFLSDIAANKTSGQYNSSMPANIIPCDNGQEFFSPYNIYSAVMEFGWTCEWKWVKPVAAMMFVFGIATGTFAGFLSDWFGRRPIFIYFTFLQFASNFLASFANSVWVYSLFIFVCGLSQLVNFVAAVVLGAECVSPERRNFLAISSFTSFAIGYGITSFLAFFISDWRWLLRVISFIVVFYIPNIWLVPESPRWLMAQGRLEEAKKVFNRISKMNKRGALSKETAREIEMEAEVLIKERRGGEATKNRSESWRMLGKIFKTPAMLGIVFVLAFSWFSVALVYYGIALSVQTLSGNLYVNTAMVGLVEIPGLAAGYLVVRYVSRPLSHGGMMIMSGIFCMGAALISNASPTAATVVGLLGKGLNAGSFYVVYIHTAEVVPTLVRNSCMGIGSFAGRIGSIISPFVGYLGDLYGLYIPYLMMSLITIASGFLTAIFTPESRLEILPETIEDSLRLKSLFHRVCGRRNNKEDSGGREMKEVDEERESIM